MKTINLKELKVYTGFSKEKYNIIDARKAFADALYSHISGVMSYSLSLRIYESKDGVEISDEEAEFLIKITEQISTPAIVDAIKEQLNS